MIHPNDLVKKINAENVLFILVLLILCGKFYYLLGFVGHLKPTSNIIVIIIKDTLIITLLMYSIKFLYKNIGEFKYTFFLTIIILIISTLHYAEGKPAGIIIQHYIRNVALIILIYPTAVFLIKEKNINFEKLVFYFSIINFVAGWVQGIFFPETLFSGRVLGLCGDPIVYSSILAISLPLLAKYIKNKITYLLCLSLFGYQIDASGSVIPLVAFIISISSSFAWQHRKKIDYKFIWPTVFFATGIYSDFLINNASATRKLITFLVKSVHFPDHYKVPDTLQGRIDGAKKGLDALPDMLNLEWNSLIYFLFGCTDCKNYKYIDIFYFSVLSNFGIIVMTLITIPFLYLLILAFKRNKIYYIYFSIFIILLSIGNPIHYKFPLNLVIILLAATFFTKTKGKISNDIN